MENSEHRYKYHGFKFISSMYTVKTIIATKINMDPKNMDTNFCSLVVRLG